MDEPVGEAKVEYQFSDYKQQGAALAFFHCAVVEPRVSTADIFAACPEALTVLNLKRFCVHLEQATMTKTWTKDEYDWEDPSRPPLHVSPRCPDERGAS